MNASRDLARIRTALVAAVALVDRLSDPRSRSIDQQVLDLLGDLDQGLTTKSLCLLIRKRRSDVVSAIRMMASSNQIARNPHGRWELTDG